MTTRATGALPRGLRASLSAPEATAAATVVTRDCLLEEAHLGQQGRGLAQRVEVRQVQLRVGQRGQLWQAHWSTHVGVKRVLKGLVHKILLPRLGNQVLKERYGVGVGLCTLKQSSPGDVDDGARVSRL